MDEINKLIGCGAGWVEEKALLVKELTALHESKSITTEEYKELLNDIANTEAITNDAADIQFKSMLVAGIAGLLQVV